MTVNSANVVPENSQIKAGLNDVLFSIRTFIDAMSNEKQSLKDFEDNLRDFLIKTIQDNSVQYRFHVEAKDVSLRPELYRDMKLCIYDVIVEMLHSGLSEIDINIVLIARQLKIIVKDKGIQEKALTYNQSGNGFSNFKKRTERHGGSFSISKNDNSEIIMELVFEV
jgi:signal transduction histidine kinase